MATAPLICKSDLANTLIEGGHFDRCTFVVTKDSSIINSFSFCDFSLDVDDFFSQSVKLNGGSAFLLDDAGLANNYGEIKFLFIKVDYPSSFIKDTDKYINLIYEGKTYPIGSVHIWTGQPGDSAGMGISVIPRENESSPLYQEGGVVLHNPHSNSVIINVILAAGGAVGISSGNSGTSGFYGYSGPDYYGTSGTPITIL